MLVSLIIVKVMENLVAKVSWALYVVNTRGNGEAPVANPIPLMVA